MGPIVMKDNWAAFGKDQNDAATKESASEQTETMTAKSIIPPMAKNRLLSKTAKIVSGKKVLIRPAAKQPRAGLN